ncbi:MAG TPA: alpha/beta hydrolase [Burkholderiales bacterium]
MRAVISLYLALGLAACTSTFFQPHHVRVHTPDELGLEYRELRLRAEDGVALTAWYFPARGAPRATVLFLHGNAENISTHFASVAWMPAEGFNVLALDYRGYGDSGGEPSLAGAQLDIDAAMRTLLARPDVDARRIVLLGQSLGGAFAIHYAAHGAYRVNLRALVTDSAFSDYRSIVREKLAGFWPTWPFQWLPWLTVDNDYSPAASIGALGPMPLLLIHGENDRIVPPQHSRRLFELAHEPKELWLVPEAGHTEALRGEPMRRRLAEYLRRVASGT